MRDERFRRFRPFRDFARSRKAETALAARFFSRFRDFDGKSKSADGRIQGHPRRRLFGGLVNATPLAGARFFEISRSRFRRKRNLEISASRVSAGREDGRLETSVSYCLIPPRSTILSEFLRFRRKVEGGDNRILAGAPGRAVPAASSVLPSLFAAQLVLCCWVDGTQDAGPSARKRRRANPALPSAAFRDFTDFEKLPRFRILRDLVQPHPHAVDRLGAPTKP